MKSWVEPAAGDHLGTDARNIAHRQAQQRVFCWMLHGYFGK